MNGPVTPLPSASLVLLRDSPAGIEILMQTRHEDAGFAAGALVFPGGKTRPEDRAQGDDLLYEVAAIRETFEECSILLARTRGKDGLLSHRDLAALKTRHPTLPDFGTLIETENLDLATDCLVRFAHWITPTTQPKRFDTQFFLARAPEDQIAAHDGYEAVSSVWIRPQDAVRQADERTIKLVFVTRLNLIKLSRCRTVADALDRARREPVITVCPEIVKTDEGVTFRIPGDAGYEITELAVTPNIARA